MSTRGTKSGRGESVHPAPFTCFFHPQCSVWKRKVEQIDDVPCCGICGCVLTVPGCRPIDDLPQARPEPLARSEPLQVRTFDVYSEAVAKSQTKNFPLEYYAGCVCEEAGELFGGVKKVVYHEHPLTPEMQTKMLLEAGDTLWALSCVARKLGSSLREVAELSIAKIAERYPNGYEAHRSQNRKPTEEFEALHKRRFTGEASR